jgi:hypothetical protein
MKSFLFDMVLLAASSKKTSYILFLLPFIAACNMTDNQNAAQIDLIIKGIFVDSPTMESILKRQHNRV